MGHLELAPRCDRRDAPVGARALRGHPRQLPPEGAAAAAAGARSRSSRRPPARSCCATACRVVDERARLDRPGRSCAAAGRPAPAGIGDRRRAAAGRRPRCRAAPTTPTPGRSWSPSRPVRLGGWWRRSGRRRSAMALAALLLLAFAGLNLRRSHRELRSGQPHRRAHRAAQPAAAHRPARPGPAAGPAPRHDLRRAAHRPRPVQGGQRHPRPPLRRRAAARRRPSACAEVFRESDTVEPARRRRVRRAAAGGRRTRRPPWRWPGGASPRCTSRSSSRGSCSTSRPASGSRSPRARPRRQRPAARGGRRDVRGEGAASPVSSSTTRSWTSTRRRGSRCSATCAARCSRTSSSCTTSPRSTCDTGRGARRGGAGALAAPRARARRRPDEFIPVAEGTGLILPLTVRTLEIAVAQARALVRRRPPGAGRRQPLPAVPARAGLRRLGHRAAAATRPAGRTCCAWRSPRARSWPTRPRPWRC